VGEVHSDGSYTLEVPYGEDWELIQDILRQGPDVEVLAPAALKKKVKETVQKMLRLY
jgi:predicted DNA-binding transcriptional regulator YafY